MVSGGLPLPDPARRAPGSCSPVSQPGSDYSKQLGQPVWDDSRGLGTVRERVPTDVQEPRWHDPAGERRSQLLQRHGSFAGGTGARAWRSLAAREPTDGRAAPPSARQPEGLHPARWRSAGGRPSLPQPCMARRAWAAHHPDIQGGAGRRADLRRLFRRAHAGGERDPTALQPWQPAGLGSFTLSGALATK